MYKINKFQYPFHYYLEIFDLSDSWFHTVKHWAKHSHLEDRHFYEDGIFYLVIPFELLNDNKINRSIIFEYHKKLENFMDQLYRDENEYDSIIKTFPSNQWSISHFNFHEYIEMMMFLYHLQDNLPSEYVHKNTTAIKFDWS